MNYNFSPSLEHMAAVKIALRLYYDKDLAWMLEEDWKIKHWCCCLDREKHELWKLITKTAAEKLPSLPDSLKVKVCQFIRPFNQETLRWFWDHDCLLGLSASGCCLTYKSVLCWKADGTVDRIQTARKLAQNRNIHPEARFAVACTYFLEDEVLALWHGNEEVRSNRNGKNPAVRFWINRLTEESCRKTPWNEMAARYFKIPCLRLSDIRLRVSSFFPHLSWEDQKNHFVHLCENLGHEDDYRLCWQAMDETKRMEIFSKVPIKGLLEYLKWPFQSLFIEMVNRLWSRMDTDLFKYLLFNIIVCIFKGLDDFDYVGLLKESWHHSPASFKNAMKEDGKFFELIEVTLNYDRRNTPLSLPETMNECVRQYLGCKCP